MAVSRRSASRSRLSSRDRSNPCTHPTLTRLYDASSDQKCSLCYRPHIFGWLYRCTEDFDGFLPSSDFHLTDTSRQLVHDAQLFTLSPSVSEAAAKGHYTDQELSILWKQKIEVRKLIRQLRPNTSSSASTASSSTHSVGGTATASTLPSTESYTDLEPDVGQDDEFLRPCRAPLEPIREVHDDLERDHKLVSIAKANSPPPCDFKVCHNCRPNYRERAWHSLESVLKTSYRQLLPPKHEFDNRKISHAGVVRKFGTGVNSLGNCGNRQEDLNTFQAAKKNSRTEFQATVQRLLRDQDSETVAYPNCTMPNCGQREELPRQVSYQSLGAITMASMDEVVNVPTPPHQLGTSFGGNTAYPSLHDNLAAPDGEISTLGCTEPRPLYHRRGLERITSITVPPRGAISHCGESTSSQDLSTSQSISSCPGIVERESLEEKAKSNDRQNQWMADKAVMAPKIVVVNADGIPSAPQKTPTETVNGSVFKFRRTPKSSSRFPID